MFQTANHTRNMDELSTLNEVGDAGAGKFRFATAATVLPIPEMRVWVTFHDITLYRCTISYGVFATHRIFQSTFLPLPSNVYCDTVL